jgi:DNA repair photolyase
MSETVPRLYRKGRGSVSNVTNRFETLTTEAIDDGWGGLDEELPPLRTTVRPDATRSIIARNDSPDIGFEQSINPYRGCEHGCVYCYARPTHAYLGLSPGQDFESRLFFKPDAARLLAEELAKPSYRCKAIALGTNTDPYQPIERERRVTRAILEVLAASDHPLSIVTKSALVVRDLDLLAPMAAKGLAKVFVSVTTLDRDLARRMEPRAATPPRRLETIAALARAGVPTGAMTAPVIPGLNDHELEAILEQAAVAGASMAGYVLIRLPLEIKELFREWLALHYPDRAERVMSLIRSCHQGRDYTATFGVRQKGTGPFSELIARRFALAVKRLGLNKDPHALDTSLFRRPRADTRQLSLFA